MGKTVECELAMSSSAASPLWKETSRVVASEPSTPSVEPSGPRARVKPSQRQLDAAAIEDALSLMGFNPRLLCHFLWGRRAASLRLALSSTSVDLDTDQEHSVQVSVPWQTLNAARRCLAVCRIDMAASYPKEAGRA